MASELTEQSSMEKVAGIEDLLVEILLRLPVRSLLSFKLVSKHWRKLISSPHICALKGKQSCKRISGILLNPRSTKESNKIDFVPLEPDQIAPLEWLNLVDGKALEGLHIIQSCNGLLLCRSKEYSFPKTEYYVINPTTRHTISFSLVVCEKGTFYHAALAFDPRKSPDFKLICLFWHDATFCVLIYTSETHSVTHYCGSFHKCEGSVVVPDSCVYWNDAINWISDHHTGLYVNVDEERFGKFPMPPQTASSRISYYGESNDHLYLGLTDTATNHLDVYEMDVEYSGWFVKFRVDLQPMFMSYPTSKRSCKAFSILAIVDKDDGENSFIVFGRPGKAIHFHLRKRDFTKICDFSGVRADKGLPLYSWSESAQYIESLAKPTRLDDVPPAHHVVLVLGSGVTGP